MNASKDGKLGNENPIVVERGPTFGGRRVIDLTDTMARLSPGEYKPFTVSEMVSQRASAAYGATIDGLAAVIGGAKGLLGYSQREQKYF
ncbi:MAG: hypothetical protein ABIH82_00045 [Candidatus Woesearchaeota archaeon]